MTASHADRTTSRSESGVMKSLGRSLSWSRRGRTGSKDLNLTPAAGEPEAEKSEIVKQATLLLHVAGNTKKDSASLVARLLSVGAPVDCSDASGFTPLALASRVGNIPVVYELLCHGANPSIASRENHNPPLFWAAASGHLECVKLLLDNKAVPPPPIPTHPSRQLDPGTCIASPAHALHSAFTSLTVVWSRH